MKLFVHDDWLILNIDLSIILGEGNFDRLILDTKLK